MPCGMFEIPQSSPPKTPMAVKTEKELSPNAKSLWLKAASAMQLQNFGYAISLLQAVLKETPEFLEGRRLLRRAEVAATKGKKSFFGGLSSASLKGPSLVKKDPRAAIELAEKTLESDPYSAAGNGLLKDAAIAANMPEIAAFALETLAEANPKDTKILHELADYYYNNQQSEKAIDVYNRIVELNPADLIAIKRGKDAAAKHSMTSGGWETAKDYRDLIKNKEEAVSLEQQSRVVHSEEMIDQQLNDLYARSESEPQSIDVARKIAGLWEQKGEIENAIWWYQRSVELTNNTDSTLIRKVADLQQKVLDDQMAAQEAALKEMAEDDPARAELQATVDELKRQKAESLLEEAKKRVERNPTDLQLRYELGEQLIEAGHYTEAIPELQRARNNPNVRIKAMNLLGRCYTGKNMLDFAVRTYDEAVKELSVMDSTKKDVLYNLGLVHEQMGNKEKSIECMKQIYEVDYGYRDVATRVESSY